MASWPCQEAASIIEVNADRLVFLCPRRRLPDAFMNGSHVILLFVGFDRILGWIRTSRLDEDGQGLALQRFKAVLRDYSSLQFVALCDREPEDTFADLRTLFGSDICSRPFAIMFGMTRSSPEGICAAWQPEIQEFLREHKLESAFWIASDAHADNLGPDAPLILCGGEFGDREEALLRVAIEERPPDPALAAALERGRAMKRHVLEQTTVLSRSDVAALLCVAPEVVSTLRLRRGLVAIPGKHGFDYPIMQFSGGALLPGLSELLQQLNDCSWSALAFLLSESDEIGGRSPIQVLKSGSAEERDAVFRMARIFAGDGYG